MIDAEYVKRVEIARDESEALLNRVYGVLCGTPAFQREHPDLDNAIRAHLEARNRFRRERGRRY